MIIETGVELQPFKVPNYVLVKGRLRVRQDGFAETPKFHLSELHEDTLNELCDQFRARVLAKAKQQ